MIDEYDIKKSLQHKVFNESNWNKEREKRKDDERRKAASLRRNLNDRRQQALKVEHDRRQEQRRVAERRSFADRRVTSNYSEEKLSEEREKLKRMKSSDRAFNFMVLSFVFILIVFIYWFSEEMGFT